MLQIGQANEVKFNVNVSGTSTTPSVKLIIGAGQTELGFKAEPVLNEPNRWFSEVKIPENFQPGSYDFRVEVLLNNRLFVPVKNKVMIESPTPVAAATEEQIPAKPATPTQTPDQTHEWEGEGGALPGTKEIPKPLPPEKVNPPTEPAPKQSLLKTFEKADKVVIPDPRRLDKVKFNTPYAETGQDGFQQRPEPTFNGRKTSDGNVKPPKKKYSVKTPLPKPGVTQTTPLPQKINMLKSVTQESAAKFDKDLVESGTYESPVRATTPINITPKIPVTLKKGEVVYE